MTYILEFRPQEPARELKDQFSIILVVHQFRSPVILQRSINLLIYHTTVVLLRHPNTAAAVLGAWIVIMVLVQDTTLSNCKGARNNCCNNFSEQILPNSNMWHICQQGHIYWKGTFIRDDWQTTLNDLLFTSADLMLSSRACKLALNQGTENGSCQDSFLTICIHVRKRESKLQFVFSCFSSAFLDDVSIFLQALYYFHSKMCGASCTHGFPVWCRLQQDHWLIPASPLQSTCQSVGHQAPNAAASCVFFFF